MDFGDLSDNPFATQVVGQPVRRQAVRSAAKVLLLVAVCLSLTLVVGSQSKRWLASRLTRDFESLSPDEKQTRLVQLADLGPIAVEPMVTALADDDIEVARAAYELLRRAQKDWTVLGRNEMERCHRAMVQALQTMAIHIPDDRTGWGSNLLQETLMVTIQRSDERSKELYREATHALELLSLSDRAGPSILSDEPLDSTVPKRLVVQTEPLPVGSRGANWTTWPPASESEAVDETIASDPAAGQHNPDSPSPVSPSPSVYRSSAARLQQVQTSDTVQFREIDHSHETAHQVVDRSPVELRSVTHLVDTPMETFNDRSVIHWLGSPHRTLREKARSELISRGYDDTALGIATQIASGDTRTRIELIDAIAHSRSIDPRPWLLMMLDDESREVQLRVISVLATINDPGIDRRLRARVADESDPAVVARIRRVLDLR